MELREIGTMLREERERRGLVLEDIAQQTRISLSSLQGIESGLSELLPHPVYAKGFIKVYGQYLGMDLSEALSDFATGTTSGQYRPVYRQAVPEREEDHPEVRSLRTGNRLSVTAFALLVVAAGATYWYFSHTAGSAPATRPAESQELETQLVPTAPVDASDESVFEPEAVVSVGSESTAAQLVEAAPAAAVEPSVAAIVQPEPVQPAPVETPKPATPSQPAQAPLASPAPQARAAEDQPAASSILVVQARETCWLQATHADGTVREYMLQPGGRARLNFNGSLSLMLGNAGGVDLVLNGQPYALNAQPGQVRRLTLP
ncbi:helix-turn-helix domain-containing protein [Desulfocurvibacter africanus]|uniref:XRE family transcriptional regulator n=1 Tax=Desulfocurvibacter africanus subsp. africanus str. Walvis Bay TaxID=690850 RepID=F3Z0W8_DESAF|nr:RodZ domain-containing protein [Desulfocurvibacter africanus]EGJ51046.1 XRE family transcriptional regulator [Desulfocurvibacter africanus subsp. africanus str. Walvis Bay]